MKKIFFFLMLLSFNWNLFSQSYFEHHHVTRQYEAICTKWESKNTIRWRIFKDTYTKCLYLDEKDNLSWLKKYPNVKYLQINLYKKRFYYIDIKNDLLGKVECLLIKDYGILTKFSLEGEEGVDSLRVFATSNIVLNTFPNFLYASKNLVSISTFLAKGALLKPKKLGELKKLRQLILLTEDETLVLFDEAYYKLKDLEELIIPVSSPVCIDSRIGELYNLKALSLQIDSIPEELWTLKDLRYLDIGNLNHLSSKVCNLERLEYFSLNTPSLPECFFELDSLRYFYNVHPLFDLTKYDFNQFPSLIKLGLYELNDSNLVVLGSLNNIKKLYVKKVSLSKPEQIECIQNLDEIYFAEKISKEFLNHIRKRLPKTNITYH